MVITKKTTDAHDCDMQLVQTDKAVADDRREKELASLTEQPSASKSEDISEVESCHDRSQISLPAKSQAPSLVQPPPPQQFSFQQQQQPASFASAASVASPAPEPSLKPAAGSPESAALRAELAALQQRVDGSLPQPTTTSSAPFTSSSSSAKTSSTIPSSFQSKPTSEPLASTELPTTSTSTSTFSSKTNTTAPASSTLPSSTTSTTSTLSTFAADASKPEDSTRLAEDVEASKGLLARAAAAVGGAVKNVFNTAFSGSSAAPSSSEQQQQQSSSGNSQCPEEIRREMGGAESSAQRCNDTAHPTAPSTSSLTNSSYATSSKLMPGDSGSEACPSNSEGACDRSSGRYEESRVVRTTTEDRELRDISRTPAALSDSKDYVAYERERKESEREERLDRERITDIRDREVIVDRSRVTDGPSMSSRPERHEAALERETHADVRCNMEPTFENG